MHEDYVTYEQSIKLKELGFDWFCNHYYDKSEKIDKYNDSSFSNYDNFNSSDFVEGIVSAPTLSQAQKWLRDVKDIIIGIDFDNWYDKYECHVYKRVGYTGENIRDTYGSQLVTDEFHEDFDTYEQALSAGIDKSLEFLKEE